MTDHADTIRRYIRDSRPLADLEWTGKFPGADANDALSALLAERQQAIDERDRANEAFTAQADLRYKAETRCEQAIDALREIAGLHYGSGKQNKTWRELARAALVSLGEIE